MTATEKNKIDNKIDNKIETKIVDINDLCSRIIHNRISDLLKIINSKYPTKFHKNVLSIELDQIMANMSLSQLVPLNNISSSGKPVAPKPIYKPISKPISKPKLAPAARCHSRIWNDIFDRITYKQILEIDKEFQVSDYNDINIKKFNKKYILGKQCARKKALDANYCLQHNRYRPHGNYMDPPSKELCFHFMIDGDYLEQMENDQ